MNFEAIIFWLTIITGILALFDLLILAPKRRRKLAQLAKEKAGNLLDKEQEKLKKPIWLFDFSRAFFPVFLLVLIIRSFIIEPFRIPTGSLEPSVLTDEFILVNKYTYGLRWPVWPKKFLSINEPQRGEIFVFRYPPNPNINYIKRVIGVPGDHIRYINKTLYINGKKIPQCFVKNTIDYDSGEPIAIPVVEKQENLDGVKHGIYLRDDVPAHDFLDITVPKGYYFAMGDNRDSSADSRYWGLVPEKNLVGKAMLVWLSWDRQNKRIRFDRMGKSMQHLGAEQTGAVCDG